MTEERAVIRPLQIKTTVVPIKTGWSTELMRNRLQHLVGTWTEAKAKGVSADTLYLRYHKGFRGEALFDFKTRKPRKNYLIRYKNKLYNLTALAEVTGIGRTTLRKRYLEGVRGSALVRATT